MNFSSVALYDCFSGLCTESQNIFGKKLKKLEMLVNTNIPNLWKEVRDMKVNTIVLLDFLKDF
jgi:hypothetical protein